jgi:tRNA (Thr-GGU) A37 N-methylase
VIHTKATDDDVKEKGDREGELEIFAEFADGLDGVDGYSHLFVLVY